MIPSPITKTEMMMLLGSGKFNSKFIDKFQCIMKPLYDLPHEIVKLHWSNELETLF